MWISEAAQDRYPVSDRGRCVSCGLLAIHQTESPRWHEATQDARGTGRLDRGGTGYERDFNTWPACFRHAADLEAEARAVIEERGLSGDGRPGANQEVITRDRHCPAWYPYSPGFPPKEHLEELRMMQLEEARRSNDEKLANLQVGSQKAIAQIQADSKKIAEATQSFTTTWTYVAVVIAVVAVIAAGVAATFTVLAFVFQR